jgi:rhodanese-related sulfurtransferase
VTPARAGAALLLLAAVGLVLRGSPSMAERLRWRADELDARLAARTVHADPAEVLGLLHDGRAPVRVLDVRDEADWNAFHLRDATRVSLDDLDRGAAPPLPPGAIVIVTSNDEALAEAAWRRLTVLGVPNAYVLAGGVNLWLDVFREGRVDATPRAAGDDRLRHALPAALGERWPEARPPADAAGGRVFEARASGARRARVEGGGCG